VNLAIDGEPVQVAPHVREIRASNWWRPLTGVGIAAGVATVAIVALQQRAIGPNVPGAAPVAAQYTTAAPGLTAQNVAIQPAAHEALSYTVPATSTALPAQIAHARLTNYVFAHSQYSSGMGQRGVLADLLIEDDEPAAAVSERPAPPMRNPDARIAP
jgi:hypothetical protein